MSEDETRKELRQALNMQMFTYVMKNLIGEIKSPLRYPGGKSRAIGSILPLVPSFNWYREPLAGGASVFFALKQRYPDKNYWINDKNEDLYLFWKFCRDSPKELTFEIKQFKKSYKNGKKLYTNLVCGENFSDPLKKAARFFVLNRITFSGLIESGGYSEQAYQKRFTESSINRIIEASIILKGTKITNKDYSDLLLNTNKDTFVFLDPPYYSKTNSKLYGKNGDLHTHFNHENFFKAIKKCKCKWLVTYDNCSKINQLFNSAHISSWQKLGWKLQYGTNNLKEFKRAKIGEELFILNYKK